MKNYFLAIKTRGLSLEQACSSEKIKLLFSRGMQQNTKNLLIKSVGGMAA